MVRLIPYWISIACLSVQGQPAYTINTIAGSDRIVEAGLATSAIFLQNQGLAIDSQGSIYVSDAGDNYVRKITPDGLIHTVASTGLNRPYGLAFNGSGILYIADLGNQCVERLNPDGALTPLLTPGLVAPRNLAFDLDGSLLISDFGGNKVWRYSPAGVLTVAAGTGKAGFSGDNGPAAAAQLNAPAGLAVDASGTLFIADSANNRIRKVVNGVISTVMSIGSPVALAASGTNLYLAAANYLGTLTTAAGTFSGVQDVALDAAGNIYYATARQVEKIGAKGLLTVIAGTGADPGYGGDGGPATAARMNGPSGLALDSSGALYISDTLNNRLRCVSPAGLMETILDSTTLSQPEGLAFDAQSNLFIADSGNHRIAKLTPAGIVTTAVGGLFAPRAVAVDSSGNLFIADTNGVLEVAGSLVSTISTLQAVALVLDRDGSLLIATPTGVLKRTASGVLVSVAESTGGLSALAVTPSGDYVTAGGNQIFLGSTAIAGGSASGFLGDGGLAAAALLNAPQGLAADGRGVVYFADTGNNRIRTLTPPTVLPLTVVNAASMAPGPIAPNEIVTLFGSGFPSLPDVRIGGISTQVFYAGPTQINALAPASIAGATVTITVSSVTSASVPVAQISPGLFAASLNEDGTLNAATDPAARQSVVTFYATGLGPDLSSLTMLIGGYTAEVLYAGAAPGFVGLEQINARIPGGFAPVGNLPVILSVSGARTQSTVAVK